MLKIPFGLLLITILLNYNSNIFSNILPSDTSFTIYSAYDKIKKQFPQAVIVKPQITKTVTLKRDLVYSTVNGNKLMLDLFTPKTKSKKTVPAVILIHGGGWHSGDKTMEHPIAAYLAEKGFVAATVEYRMAMEYPYPAAVHDLKAAIRWLRANAKKYNIDINKIAALGCSAGAELATFIGTTNGMKQFEGSGDNLNYSSNVQAIVNIDGIVDFMHINSTKHCNNPAKPCAADNWFGGSYKTIPEKWKEASPITYAGKTTPPIIFINSALEDYHAGREEFINILKPNNVYYEVHTIPETPHPFWLFDPWYKTVCEYTYNFLNKIFIKGIK